MGMATTVTTIAATKTGARAAADFRAAVGAVGSPAAVAAAEAAVRAGAGRGKSMIDDGMRQRIVAAIGKAEQGTRAEFVAAVAKRSDEYRSNSLMAGLAG